VPWTQAAARLPTLSSSIGLRLLVLLMLMLLLMLLLLLLLMVVVLLLLRCRQLRHCEALKQTVKLWRHVRGVLAIAGRWRRAVLAAAKRVRLRGGLRPRQVGRSSSCSGLHMASGKRSSSPVHEMRCVQALLRRHPHLLMHLLLRQRRAIRKIVPWPD
jgi:hypothetical protein